MIDFAKRLEKIKITLDFETQSRAPLKKIGAYEYSMDPSTIVTCLGFKSNKFPQCPLFKYPQMQRPWAEFPEAFKKLFTSWTPDPNVVFSGHNATFEQCIYNNVLVKRFGWPAIPIHKWRCTAAKAASVAIPRNLADAGAVMRLSVQKDFEGHRVMMKLCKPTAAFVKWEKQDLKYISRGQDALSREHELSRPPEFWTPETAPEDFETLYKYCKIDVRSEEKLDESLPDLIPTEQALWFLDQKINLRGVQVDMPTVNKIAAIMASESKIMGKELDALTMGLVSSGNARNAILDFLTLEGLELPDLKAKTVEDFLTNGKATGDAKKLLEIRRALSKASTAKYKKFQECAASDGRARDLFMYHAASTGRWGGKNVQPQNFPRGIIKNIEEAIYRINTCNLLDLKLLYGENLMPLFSSVLRGMFIASPGHELFVEDLSAIECRVLWWLADHQEGLQFFRDGIDPYVVMAAAIFKKSILEITDDERQVGKAAVLGCGFQMAGKKFMTAAWDVYRARVTLELAKIAVSIYREKHYPVTELWDNYQNAAIFAIENKGRKYRAGKCLFFVENSFLWIELPSGRRLAYKDPSVAFAKTVVMHLEDDTIYASTATMYKDALAKGYKKINEFQSKRIYYWATNHKAKKIDCVIPKWTRESTYGGKLAENITQAVARDILAGAIVRAEKAEFKVAMHSHDELVSEALKGKFKTVLDSKGNRYCPEYRDIMETVPAWADGLPLKSGGWVGTRYKKG